MSKLVLILSMFGLMILLTFGVSDPNSPIMWLASTSNSFAILRGFLLIVLLALLVTDPPRNVYFRAFVSLLAIGLVGWAIGATYENHMKLLDSMSLLEVGISAGLIALEREPKKETLPFPGYEISSVRRLQLAHR